MKRFTANDSFFNSINKESGLNTEASPKSVLPLPSTRCEPLNADVQNFYTSWRSCCRNRAVVSQIYSLFLVVLACVGINCQVMAQDRSAVSHGLSVEVLRLLDIAKKFRNQSGLILNRRAIYETLGVLPTDHKVFKTTDDARHFSERLVFESDERAIRAWEASLVYDGPRPKKATWVVRINLDLRDRSVCYPSRDVEAYWGEPFIYKPPDVHALLEQLIARQQGVADSGPHDGRPYTTGFRATYADSAAVVFDLGANTCLQSISIGNQFNVEDFSDANIYYQ